MSITFVSNRAIHRLNKKYRGINQPTDVLAFAMQEGKFKGIQPDILGDVIISTEMARVQAFEFGHSLNEEIMILLIHGILHLVGYDHVNKTDKKRMEEKEKELLGLIGQNVIAQVASLL